MAIFDSTIFRDLSGSVGNVTAYKLGDKQVARAKTFVVRDAKSLAQLKQRLRMKEVARLRRGIVGVLPLGFCTSSRKVCLNGFLKENIKKVEVDDDLNVTFDLLSLSLSAGELALPSIQAEVDGDMRWVMFHWVKQPLMPYMFKDDRLYGVVYESGLRRCRKVELGTRGVSGDMAWELPRDWDAGKLVVYGFAVSADGKKASGTLGVCRS